MLSSRWLPPLLAPLLLLPVLTMATLWGEDAPLLDRQGKALPPIATLATERGTAQHGSEVFLTYCSLCHQINGIGVDFGPHLVDASRRLDRAAFYTAILAPSAAIEKGYETTVLAIDGGDTVRGIVVGETADAIMLKVVGGLVNTYQKTDVLSRTTSPVSLMPDQLQRGMTHQDLVDLVEYLVSLATVPHSAQPGR